MLFYYVVLISCRLLWPRCRPPLTRGNLGSGAVLTKTEQGLERTRPVTSVLLLKKRAPTMGPVSVLFSLYSPIATFFYLHLRCLTCRARKYIS